MSNLVGTLKSNFSEDLLGRLVPYLGVDSETVRAVVDSGIDALAATSSGSGGLGALAGLRPANEFDHLWRAEGGLIGLASQGAAVLDALVGDRKSDVVSQVASATGAKNEVVEKALCIISSAMSVSPPNVLEESVEAPKPTQKKRITVGNLEEVQEAVVATPDVPAPAPLNFPVAEPAPTKSPSKVSEPTTVPASAGSAANRIPTFAALVVVGVLSVIGLMKGCGSAPAETQPTTQPNQTPISSDAKIEDPAFPVNPEINAPTK